MISTNRNGYPVPTTLISEIDNGTRVQAAVTRKGTGLDRLEVETRVNRRGMSIDPEGSDSDRSIDFLGGRLISRIHNSLTRTETSTLAFTGTINKTGKDIGPRNISAVSMTNVD